MYSPERHGMYCPFCESGESGERAEGQSGALTVCPNCGGEVPVSVLRQLPDFQREGGGKLQTEDAHSVPAGKGKL